MTMKSKTFQPLAEEVLGPAAVGGDPDRELDDEDPEEDLVEDREQRRPRRARSQS